MALEGPNKLNAGSSLQSLVLANLLNASSYNSKLKLPSLVIFSNLN